MFLYSAFVLGLAGSFHCIGMCGPIALALPVKPNGSRFWSILTYNVGRVLTYAFLGGIIGLLGKGFVLAGIQQKISVAIGILILISLFLPSTFLKYLKPNKELFRFAAFLKQKLSELFKRKSYSSLLSIGLINGLLPCGFVYIALAGAAINTSLTDSIYYMTLFGLGTVPMMMSISWLKHILKINIRNNIRMAMPVLTFMFAVLFIVRGLNLGIPYLSPQFDSNKPAHVNCCHK